jgi:hypothetical protein
MGKSWGSGEIQSLEKYYPTASKKDLISLFPDRTYQALSRFASKRGIIKSTSFKRRACTDTWTEEESQVLKQTYETASGEMICKLIPNKSHKAIRHKAWKLGLRKVVIDSACDKKRWSPEEAKLLIDNYSTAESSKLIELFPDRKMSSLADKAKCLGVRRNCQSPWTKNDGPSVKKLYQRVYR